MNNKSGLLLMIASGLIYSTAGLTFKYIEWSPLAITSGRTFLCMIVVSIYMTAKKHKLKLNRFVMLGAACITGTGILYSYANKLTTAGNSIILQYTAPAIVVLLNLFILHKKPEKADIRTCVLVFAGILLFFIDALSAGNMLGNILAFMSAFTYAGVFMINSSDDGDPLSAIFFGCLLSFFIGLPSLMGTDIAASSPRTLISLLFMGLVQQGAGHIFFAEGIQRTNSVTASLVAGVEPIMNPVLVAIFYGELLSPLSLFGAAIVLISITYYSYRQARA